MKRYRITVNGKVFDVDVEEAGPRTTSGTPSSAAAPVVPRVISAPTPAPVAAPAKASSGPAAPAAGGNVMKSPLPGKVLKVMATPGSSWKKGDTLLIIEAMKMENEILAPRDCVVEEVAVTANQTVKTGDLLLKLK